MKGGIALLAPAFVAIAICGLTAGDDPPIAGKAWQPAQESRLKRGPSPLPGVTTPETESTSWNVASPLLKAAVSPDVRPLSASPVEGEFPPPFPFRMRGPGSCCATTEHGNRRKAAQMAAWRPNRFP